MTRHREPHLRRPTLGSASPPSSARARRRSRGVIAAGWISPTTTFSVFFVGIWATPRHRARRSCHPTRARGSGQRPHPVPSRLHRLGGTERIQVSRGRGQVEDYRLDPPELTARQRLLAERVHAALAELPERDALILRARHGLDGPPRTLAHVGSTLGLSRERVRQLQIRAERRLAAVIAAA